MILSTSRLCNTAQFWLKLILVLRYCAFSQWLSLEAARDRMPGQCKSDEFNCLIDGDCIPLHRFHDCVLDCLDGSDEYCFPGHIKCNDYCVDLKDFGECLLKPRCGLFNSPKYCTKLSRIVLYDVEILESKICLHPNSLPCKGYGECALSEWINDGKKDCNDGSDEDPEYIEILSRIKRAKENFSTQWPYVPTKIPNRPLTPINLPSLLPFLTPRPPYQVEYTQPNLIDSKNTPSKPYGFINPAASSVYLPSNLHQEFPHTPHVGQFNGINQLFTSPLNVIHNVLPTQPTFVFTLNQPNIEDHMQPSMVTNMPNFPFLSTLPSNPLVYTQVPVVPPDILFTSPPGVQRQNQATGIQKLDFMATSQQPSAQKPVESLPSNIITNINNGEINMENYFNFEKGFPSSGLQPDGSQNRLSESLPGWINLPRPTTETPWIVFSRYTTRIRGLSYPTERPWVLREPFGSQAGQKQGNFPQVTNKIPWNTPSFPTFFSPSYPGMRHEAYPSTQSPSADQQNGVYPHGLPQMPINTPDTRRLANLPGLQQGLYYTPPTLAKETPWVINEPHLPSPTFKPNLQDSNNLPSDHVDARPPMDTFTGRPIPGQPWNSYQLPSRPILNPNQLYGQNGLIYQAYQTSTIVGLPFQPTTMPAISRPTLFQNLFITPPNEGPSQLMASQLSPFRPSIAPPYGQPTFLPNIWPPAPNQGSIIQPTIPSNQWTLMPNTASPYATTNVPGFTSFNNLPPLPEMSPKTSNLYQTTPRPFVGPTNLIPSGFPSLNIYNPQLLPLGNNYGVAPTIPHGRVYPSAYPEGDHMANPSSEQSLAPFRLSSNQPYESIAKSPWDINTKPYTEKNVWPTNIPTLSSFLSTKSSRMKTTPLISDSKSSTATMSTVEYWTLSNEQMRQTENHPINDFGEDITVPGNSAIGSSPHPTIGPPSVPYRIIPLITTPLPTYASLKPSGNEWIPIQISTPLPETPKSVIDEEGWQMITYWPRPTDLSATPYTPMSIGTLGTGSNTNVASAITNLPSSDHGRTSEIIEWTRLESFGQKTSTGPTVKNGWENTETVFPDSHISTNGGVEWTEMSTISSEPSHSTTESDESKASSPLSWTEWFEVHPSLEVPREGVDELFSEDDLKEFPNNIDIFYIKTPKEENLSCLDWVHKHVKEKMTNPMCGCPPGQMKNVKGKCQRAKITTFEANVDKICNSVKDHDHKQDINLVVLKLAASLNHSFCVRRHDNKIIVNTICHECTLHSLYKNLSSNHSLPEIKLKLSELPRSACYHYDLNDCDEKAECIPKGLTYKCKCLEGTRDVSNGTGRKCEGVVIATTCTKFLGICIIFWIMLLLLLLLLLPLLLYLCWRCCKKYSKRRLVQSWRRKTKKPTKTVKVHPVPEILGKDTDIESATSLSSETWSTKQSKSYVVPINPSKLAMPSIDVSERKSAIIHSPDRAHKFIEETDIETVAPHFINKKDSEVKSISSDFETTLDKETKTVIPVSTSTIVPAEVHTPRVSSGESIKSSSPTIWDKFKVIGFQYVGQRRKSSSSLESLIKRREAEKNKKLIRKHSLTPSMKKDSSKRQDSLKTKKKVVPGMKLKKEKHPTDSDTSSIASRRSRKIMPKPEVTSTSPKISSRRSSIQTIKDEKEDSKQGSPRLNARTSTPRVPSASLIKDLLAPEKIAEELGLSAVAEAIHVVSGLPDELKDRRVSESSSETVILRSPKIRAPDEDSTAEIAAQLVSSLAPLIEAEGKPWRQRRMSKTSIKSSASTVSKTSSKRNFVKENIVESKKAKEKAKSAQVSPKVSPKKKKNDVASEPASPKIARSMETSPTRTFLLRKKKVTEEKIKMEMYEEDQISVSSRKPIKKQFKSTIKSAGPLKDREAVKATDVLLVEDMDRAPKVPRKPLLPPEARRKPRPIPSRHITSTIRPQQSPLKRKTSIISTKSMPISRPLSNISEKSEDIIVDTDSMILDQLPVSISCPTTSYETKTRIPKPPSYWCECREPDFYIADLDLDLPGPYMIPASMEDIRDASMHLHQSHIPRLNNLKQPPNQERIRQRAISARSDTVLTYKRGDFIRQQQEVDFDLYIGSVPSLQQDQTKTTMSRQSTSTIRRKITSRKLTSQKLKLSPSISATSSTERLSTLHTILDRPEWDPSPLREGELDKIPLDFQLTRSHSSMNLDTARSSSQKDVSPIPIKMESRKAPKQKQAWTEELKQSLSSNSWLDYD